MNFTKFMKSDFLQQKFIALYVAVINIYRYVSYLRCFLIWSVFKKIQGNVFTLYRAIYYCFLL